MFQNNITAQTCEKLLTDHLPLKKSMNMNININRTSLHSEVRQRQTVVTQIRYLWRLRAKNRRKHKTYRLNDVKTQFNRTSPEVTFNYLFMLEIFTT